MYLQQDYCTEMEYSYLIEQYRYMYSFQKNYLQGIYFNVPVLMFKESYAQHKDENCLDRNIIINCYLSLANDKVKHLSFQCIHILIR